MTNTSNNLLVLKGKKRLYALHIPLDWIFVLDWVTDTWQRKEVGQAVGHKWACSPIGDALQFQPS